MHYIVYWVLVTITHNNFGHPKDQWGRVNAADGFTVQRDTLSREFPSASEESAFYAKTLTQINKNCPGPLYDPSVTACYSIAACWKKETTEEGK